MSARSVPKSPERLILDICLCLAIAVGARYLASFGGSLPIASLTLFGAMALSAAYRFALKKDTRLLHYEVPLSLGLILLGVQILPSDLAELGWSAPLWILGYQTFFAMLFYALVKCGCFAKREGGLLAMGLSGAGLSSVLATLKGDPDAPQDAAPMVLSGLLTHGAIGFVCMPIISDRLHLSAAQMACWSGVCMPTTAESVMVAASHSDEALRQAAAWRLLINLLQWVPIVIYLGLFAAPVPKGKGPGPRALALWVNTIHRIPLFVWALTLVGAFSCTTGFTPEERQVLGELTTWSFLIALAGLGWSTRPQKVFALGIKRMCLLFTVWAGSAAGLLWLLL
ncbi:MAG: putative sulfate exporter family transporter [Planctomycetes bacterium]|nr:putative sulfate exporter family transporter [Planctomycetota bacterium]